MVSLTSEQRARKSKQRETFTETSRNRGEPAVPVSAKKFIRDPAVISGCVAEHQPWSVDRVPGKETGGQSVAHRVKTQLTAVVKPDPIPQRPATIISSQQHTPPDRTTATRCQDRDPIGAFAKREFFLEEERSRNE